MTEKRFTITQKEDYFYVRDEVNRKPMGMFEFKEDEFPVYFCFHKIIDLLNQLNDENEQLKQQLSNVQILYKSTDDNLFACRKTNNELRECYSKLEKENEQLKQRIKVLEDTIDGLTGTIAHFDLDEVMWND
ncbi:MAG: hypothetical protein IKF11_09705 [Methanobrevibacter sp.]|nr:hypothetical protein [Methanobrevibacter sp.]